MPSVKRNDAVGISRRLKVAYVSHTAAPSGAERSLLELLGELDVDRAVVLGADGPLRPALEKLAYVEVLPLPAVAGVADVDESPAQLLRTAPALAAYTIRLAGRLAAMNIDVVHTNSLKSALYGGAAARLAGKPCVIHVRDRLAADYLNPASARLIRMWIRHVARVAIANSTATAATLDPRTRSVVIPSPIALAAQPRPREIDDKKNLVFGTASRISPWKGQLEFLRAFSRAFPDGPHRAVILGDALFGESAYAVALRREVETLGLSSRVEFRGHVVDVGAELEGFDVLVHTPRIPEPFGRIIVEAMACGAAVVARGDGGPAEIITNDFNGLLYPPGDDDALVAAMRRMTGPDLRRRLTASAFGLLPSYTPAVIARRTEDVYRAAVSR
jgi:glycosyltransferase involved in cell wall biosynthesis